MKITLSLRKRFRLMMFLQGFRIKVGLPHRAAWWIVRTFTRSDFSLKQDVHKT
jgi:hypothetical protein